MGDTPCTCAVADLTFFALEIAYSTVSSTPAAWALALCAHRVGEAISALHRAFVAELSTPRMDTLAGAAILAGDTIDTHETTDLAEAPFPCGGPWADTGIACCRWLGIVATCQTQCTLIASFPSPLVFTHASCARTIGNSILALNATFIARLSDPVALAFAPAAILLHHPVVALALQPTL